MRIGGAMVTILTIAIVGFGCLLVTYLLWHERRQRLATLRVKAEILVAEVRAFLLERDKDWDEEMIAIRHEERLMVVRHGKWISWSGCIALYVNPAFGVAKLDALPANIFFVASQFARKERDCLLAFRVKGIDPPEEAMLDIAVEIGDVGSGRIVPMLVPLALGVQYRNFIEGTCGDVNINLNVQKKIEERLMEMGIFCRPNFGEKGNKFLLDHSMEVL